MSKKLLPVLILSLSLGACGVTDMFQSKAKKPLKGERISIMELQKSLQPDEGLQTLAETALPEIWQNQFWPQAGGYPNHSMQHLALGPGPLKVKWHRRIGTGTYDELPLTAQPVVVDGAVYTLDTKSVLSRIDAETGKVDWRLNIRDVEEDDLVIGGGIAYASGVLYVTNGYNEIITVDPEKGEVVWKRDLPAAVRAAPTVMDGRLFVTTLDNRLIAMNAADGEILWDYQGLAESAGLIGAASPGANRAIVVPAFSSGEISALRVENGSVAWSDNLSSFRQVGGLAGLSDIRALPVLDKGLVIAMSFNGRLVAIDERTGRRIWQREISGAETPWVAGDQVFVLSENNELVALSRDDGSIYWVTDLPRFRDPEDREGGIRWTGPILAGERLILASDAKKFIEVDPRSGEISRQFEIDAPVVVAPVVAGGTLYLLGENGILTAYE